MILVIRCVGVLNAAIWLGAAVCITATVPAFFRGEINTLGLHAFYPPAIAQMVLTRFFYLQYICGAIAMAHLLAEWVYLGRALRRFTFGLLIGLVIIAFSSGLWMGPKLKHLYLVKWSMSEQYKPIPIPDDVRREAVKSFAFWHGVSRVIHLVTIAGLGLYFWRIAYPSDNLRFVSAPKFRS